MIDLHSHTTASDGQYSPLELLTLAAGAGITTLAVTDHDTVSGLAAARQAAQAVGVRLVDGIEITTIANRREIHLLGHFVDPSEPRLVDFGEHLRLERAKRMELMVGKMKGLGFPVSMEQVRDLAGAGHLTRPHLARVMVELGYCADVREVFNRFLADGGPAAVPRYEVSVAEAVKLIHDAGGTATVAHPGVSKVTRLELEEFTRAGLDGLEAGHADHPPSLREKLEGWALELGLVATAGSDFHGEKIAADRKLGCASMSAEALAALQARRP